MKKKGFTLIELLAVIIILAVIALIATPVVLNVLENARREANKNSVYGLLDAAKLYYADSMLDESKKQNVNGTTNLIEVMPVSGRNPDSGAIYIDSKGQTALAVVYDEVCYVKHFDSSNIIESEDVENCSLDIEETPIIPEIPVSGPTKIDATENDTYKAIVYLDPTDLSKTCNESNSIVTTGTKTGCMKWYAYSEDQNSYNLILAHNTTSVVAWNSSNDNTSMNEVATTLENDTTGWDSSLNARLIKAQEVATITGNTSFNAETTISSEWFYFDSNDNENKIANGTNKSNYAWLYDYTSGCNSHGCNIEDNSDSNMYGYWTDTAVYGSSSAVWFVFRNSCLYGRSANSVTSGVRPVITITKDIIYLNKEETPEVSYKCKRATILHTEECTQTDLNKYCGRSGYTTSGTIGTTTITYGNEEVTEDILTSGDAFDCDVNGDGVYDSKTERFYYVSELDSNSDYAVLVYYNNTTLGIADNTSSSLIAYYSSLENWHGPVEAIKNLPKAEQWNNVTLTNSNRTITTQTGTTSTTGGTLPSAFSYEGYSSRLLTYQEIATACGGDGNPTSYGELDTCNYLLENTKYSSGSNRTSGYWIETTYSYDDEKAWQVNANNFLGNYGVNDDSIYGKFYGVRPAIEVLKTDIQY